MQPLPSALPPTLPLAPPPPSQTSTPPPPPPPPRLPIAAFTSAAANASLHPPSRRRPTLHIIVVLGSATVPILRHAHHALCSLSAKGVHVFLQTETERVGSPTVTPITPDVVPDVITACRADFIVLIADRNVPSRTVQVRLSPTAEFVDVPLSELPDTVLAAWTQQLRTVPDRLQHILLAFNPNIVTAAHLDLLLQSYSGISSIRRSYARLARLANITQSWVHTNASETDAKIENHINIQNHTPTTAEAAADSQQPSAVPENDVGTSLPDALILKALRDGFRRISSTQSEKNTDDQRQTPKSDITFCWLKRSESMSARLLRSQLQACELHRKLVNSVDVISSLPITSSPLAPFNGVHLPTEAHRQRLLREINDILPRIEELGQRLSKRPRTQRRRRHFYGANPWMSYVAQARLHTESNPTSSWGGEVQHESQVTLWRCFACRTLNESRLQACKVCQAGNHKLSTATRPANSDVFRKRLRESMKNTNGVPSPWIFAPGTMPLQPPMNASPLNGIMRREHGKLDAPVTSFMNDDALRQGMKDPQFGSPPIHEVKQPNYQQFDLGSAIQALSFDDEYNGFSSDTNQAAKRTGDHRNAYRQPSPSRPNRGRQSPSSSASNATVSPVRLASSAPNGRAPIEFTSQRLPNGIRSTTSPQMIISQQRISHSSQHVNLSTEHEAVQPGPSSMLVGSFPGASMFSANLPYETGSVKNQNDAHPQDLFRPKDVASSGISRDHAVTPSKAGLNSAMEELAFGSYEAAVEPRNRLSGNHRRVVSNPIVVPGSVASDETPQSEITSLEALAAASDAANGGTGSATQESLRAVSAVVTPNRGQSGKQSRSKSVPNGTYNMF